MMRRLMLTGLLLAMTMSLASCGISRVAAPGVGRQGRTTEIGRNEPMPGGTGEQPGNDEQPIAGRH
jgi:hypothetical protein